MNIDSLNEMADSNKEIAEEVTGYEFTDADLEYTKKLISQIAGKYVRIEQKKIHNRKVKTANRAANKAAKKSRKVNRRK